MTQLERKLGRVDGAILVIANVIGVGIFTTPGIIAGNVVNSTSFMIVWIAGGVMALIGAYAYSYLASHYPESGGEYVYLGKAYGLLPGFLTGWTSFVAGFSGAIAASAVGFGAYFSRAVNLHYASADVTIGAVIIIITTIFHIVGLRSGKILNFWLAGVCVLTIILLIAVGLTSSQLDANTIITPAISTDGFLVALVPVMFTYSGYNAVSYVAGEIRRPGKNLIPAQMWGTIAVIVVYLLLNFLYVGILPYKNLDGTIEVGYEMGAAVFGQTGLMLVTIIILLALLSSVSAMVMAGPRIYYAMAKDGVFHAAFGHLHLKYKTPYIAIILQTVWCITLVLTGTFENILLYTGFSIILFSAIAVSSAFILVRRKGKRIGPFRTILFGIFIVISILIVINAIIYKPFPSLAGLIIILTGIPVFYWFKTYNRRLNK